MAQIEILEGGQFGSGVWDFLKDVGGDKEVKTEAIKTGVQIILGTPPEVIKTNPAYNTIRFTKKHRTQIEALFNKKTKSFKNDKGKTKVSNVKFDIKSLVVPLLLKKALPYILLTFGGGVLIGKFVWK